MKATSVPGLAFCHHPLAAKGKPAKRNAFSQRVHKKVGNTSHLYMYDEEAQFIGEYTGTGGLVQEIIWFEHIPMAILKANTTFYIHSDQLNTPKQISDSKGRTRWAWDSLTFGATSPNENPKGLGQFTFNVRHAGQYYDAESGLFENWHRSYSPLSGRYIQSDPIGLAGGLNTYAYVENNPLSFVDPWGLDKWDYDGWGNTAVCSYYDDLAKKSGCKYYQEAAKICRGQYISVNGALSVAATSAWAQDKTSDSLSAIADKVRGALIQYDQAARAKYGTGNNNPPGNAIDEYHNQAFTKAGLDPYYYGGNRWPQGAYPNPVPFDSEGKSFYPAPTTPGEDCGCAQ